MTEPASGTDSSLNTDIPAPAEQAVRRRIDEAARRAHGALLWEAAWPRIVPVLCAIGLFLVFSWIGLWSWLPELARFGIVGLFVVALIVLAVRLARIATPNREQALARVAAASDRPHRPATAFSDRLAQDDGDPLTKALWRAHRLQLLKSLDRLRAGFPRPGMNRRDPYAIRFLVPLLLLVAFLMAGPDRLNRLADAVSTAPAAAVTPPRIDAWVTPPAYTGRPPIFLTGDALKSASANAGAPTAVPRGSIVTVRIGDDHGLTVAATAGDGKALAFDAANGPAVKDAPAVAGQPSIEQHLTLTADSAIAISQNQKPLLSWKFAVIADQPPKISFTHPPTANASGSLSIGYTVSDDYGVVSAKAIITEADAALQPGAHPLFAAPDLPLSLPRLRMRDGTGETIRDLSAHPWAGAKVKMTLTATDEAGQTGSSAPIEFTLPMRRFGNPIARAVVEQRRILALDATKALTVVMGLDAITIDPSKFDKDGVYLSLRVAYRRLVEARNDDDLRSVVDFLWEIALGIEDGNLSLAAQDLRAAQDALQKALENNASDAEIDKAMADLRAAMDKYLEAMAQNALKNPQANRQAADPNAQTLRPQDLQKMLDQIENLAKTGSRDAAKQMLSELQQMMENLQAGEQPQDQGQQSQSSQNQALDKLGDMIRRQQELMDKTYKMDPDTDGSGAPNKTMTPEERAQALEQLRKGQQDLQSMLDQLQKQMQQQGMQPDGKLGQAGRSMGEATDQLGKGAPSQAVGPQGQALQALRDGAKGLAEQMARQNRTGMRQGGNAPGQDPLGRKQQGRGTDLGSTVKVPDAIDTQRARELLDIIRRRLGDAARPLIERDYLERLLEQY